MTALRSMTELKDYQSNHRHWLPLELNIEMDTININL